MITKSTVIKKCPECGTQVWIIFDTDDPNGPFIPKRAYCHDTLNCKKSFTMEEYEELEEWNEESPFDKFYRLSAP